MFSYLPGSRALVLSLFPSIVFAAAPNAGDLMRAVPGTVIVPTPRPDIEVLPRTEAESRQMTQTEEFRVVVELKVPVKGFKINGVSAFPDSEIQALVADARGKQLSFKELQALPERISTYYRARDYFLARAFLPAQKITDGIVEITVREGRLGQLNLAVDPDNETESVRPYLSAFHPGDLLQGEPLQHDLLILSDVPGVQVQSLLKPGAVVGTTDLDVKVKNEHILARRVQFDNYGNRYTGEYRLSGYLSMTSPWRFGDQLDLVAMTTGKGFNFGRASWQTPYGHDGTQVGVAGALMTYKLGSNFSWLDGHGLATDVTVFGSKPLLRSTTRNVLAQGAFDLKSFDDVANTAPISKHAQVLSLGLLGAWTPAGGDTAQGLVSMNLGHLVLDALGSATDALQTEGYYLKFGFNADYRMAWSGGLSLGLRAAAQMAGKNLDTSEKFSLGGPQAVRAYATGEGAADDATLFSAELAQAWGDDLNAKLFFDSGSGRVAHNPLPTDLNNPLKMAGMGLGLDKKWIPERILLQTAVAMRSTGVVNADVDRRPRFWLLVSKSF
jgi:hemolysin activation/secretion protein